MAIEEKTYPMCNYNTSKLIVGLRDRAEIMDGGRRDEPTVFPFTMNELQQINSNSPLIKCGYLIPRDDIKEYIYETLRIPDWQNILTDEQIEQIVLHPTVEGLQKLININNSMYFERVYGAYMGLKCIQAPISANVIRLIEGRYKELQRGKITSEFTVTERDVASLKQFEDSAVNNEVEDLKKQLAEQQKLIADLMAATAKAGTTTEQPKTAKKTTTKKTTSEK